MQNLGFLIRSHRERCGLSQGELASKFGFTTPQFISNLERGISGLPPDMIGRLSKLLKIRSNDLIDAHLSYQVQKYIKTYRRRVR